MYVSSGLWPFATVQWPSEVPPSPKSLDLASDYARFYPAPVLETGYETLFLWAARMVRVRACACVRVCMIEVGAKVRVS